MTAARPLNLVAIACVLAGGLFYVYATWLKDPAPDDLGPFLARVNDAILEAAVEGRGPEEALLTLVIGDPQASPNPLTLTRRAGGLWARLLKKDNKGEFVARLTGTDGTIGWVPTHPFDTDDAARIAPFARMLVKAADAGVTIRIAAQGEAVAFVARAAERATAEAGRPVVSRLVGAGVRLSDIKARPTEARVFDRTTELREFVLLWIDPDAVPSMLHVESNAEPFERAPSYEDWESLVKRALAGGANALEPAPTRPAPATRRIGSTEGRAFNKTLRSQSGLDMLKKESRDPNALPQDDSFKTGRDFGDPSRWHPLGRGWYLGKTLGGFTYLGARDGATALYQRSPTMIHVSNDLARDHYKAREVCRRAGKEVVETTLHGLPASVCGKVPFPEDSRPHAHHDLFTIEGKNYSITIRYTYETAADREGGLQMYHNVLGMLEKE